MNEGNEVSNIDYALRIMHYAFQKNGGFMTNKNKTKIAPTVSETDKVYVNIGPSIRGLIMSGSIFRGTRRKVVSMLSVVLEKYPKVERLLVPSEELAEARKKIKIEGNSLSNAYRTLLSDNKKG